MAGTVTAKFKKDVKVNKHLVKSILKLFFPKINSVTLNAWVETKTSFQITTSKGQSQRYPTFVSKKHFAKDKIIEHQLDVPAGSKSWNFSFELDKDVRSTFTGDFGSTKYCVSVHVDLPGFDKTETVEIFVSHYR